MHPGSNRPAVPPSQETCRAFCARETLCRKIIECIDALNCAAPVLADEIPQGDGSLGWAAHEVRTWIRGIEGGLDVFAPASAAR